MSWISNQLEISHSNHTPLRPMEGLRGIAVFLVFLFHYCSLTTPFINPNSISGTALQFIHGFGDIGVDLFFVLSGFLIYGTLIRKPTKYTPYIKKRITRIYPTFLAVFVLYLALSVIMPSESKLPNGITNSAIYIIQNLLLLPGILDIKPMITVAWSLSYEFLYYLLMPLIIASLRMRSWHYKARIAFWSIVSIVGFAVFHFYGGHIRLIIFVSGILLYEIYDNKLIRPPAYFGTFCLLLAVTTFAVRGHLGLSGIIPTLILFILFFFTCLESFVSKTGSARWLTYTPLRWLGNMSYSYYLIHGLTLKACFFAAGAFLELSNQNEYIMWLGIAPLFAVTLIVSFGLFVIIERPLSLQSPTKK